MRQRCKLRFKVWKDWYKKCMNGRVYKFLVLFGLRKSPTFEMNYAVAKAYEKYGDVIFHHVYGPSAEEIKEIFKQYSCQNCVNKHLYGVQSWACDNCKCSSNFVKKED